MPKASTPHKEFPYRALIIPADDCSFRLNRLRSRCFFPCREIAHQHFLPRGLPPRGVSARRRRDPVFGGKVAKQLPASASEFPYPQVCEQIEYARNCWWPLSRAPESDAFSVRVSSFGRPSKLIRLVLIWLFSAIEIRSIPMKSVTLSHSFLRRRRAFIVGRDEHMSRGRKSRTILEVERVNDCPSPSMTTSSRLHRSAATHHLRMPHQLEGDTNSRSTDRAPS